MKSLFWTFWQAWFFRSFELLKLKKHGKQILKRHVFGGAYILEVLTKCEDSSLLMGFEVLDPARVFPPIRDITEVQDPSILWRFPLTDVEEKYVFH